MDENLSVEGIVLGTVRGMEMCDTFPAPEKLMTWVGR